MSAQVNELVQAIRHLSDEDRLELLRQLNGETAELVFLDELQVRYAGQWVAVALPEGEDPNRPRHGRLLAHGPDDEAVWSQANRLNTTGFFTFSVVARRPGLTSPWYSPMTTARFNLLNPPTSPVVFNAVLGQNVAVRLMLDTGARFTVIKR